MLGAFFYLKAQNKHLISDKIYREQVEKQFDDRISIIKNRDRALLSIFKKNLSIQQREALKFLYAYMPLSDLADYDGDFFLKQVDVALKTRETFSWGRQIPEKIFLHFVLAYRVNNADLDTARVVFYNELKSRVKGLSMREAALEVNHWCHEKVNYKASDIRTSSPLATMKTSWGRCGEESTFTVTALRAVGIPARQVYTPRWAHTDDNHAWVEVFVDNKWQYLGACEPEPELNKGWFDKPVKRAMMVHTRVFGRYTDKYNSLENSKLYTKINTLENYTKTKKLYVKVIDSKNSPVYGAKISFGIYNYSEFYPMAKKVSDKNGLASITTGLGDLLISASKNNLYGEAKSIGTSMDTVYVKITKMKFHNRVDTLLINPPIELEIKEINGIQQAKNKQRLEIEDSIRNSYQATFMKEKEMRDLSKSLGLNTERVVNFIQKSFGNWREITQYLKKNARDSRVLDLLKLISEKDLRDVPESTLTSHLKATEHNASFPTEIYEEGILNPRLQNEFLRPWRAYLQSKFSKEFKQNAQKDINLIIDWISKNITLNTTDNYTNCPISPIGTYELKFTDEQGRNLFFVAFCRSVDIPARINKATYQPQYYKNGQWLNVSFGEKESISNERAYLVLNNDNQNVMNPEYYIHFTLQYFRDGSFHTLDYEYSSIFDKFPSKIQLQPGYYCLMTGHRDDKGNIRVLRKFFTLRANETVEKTITLLPLDEIKKVLGKIKEDFYVKNTKNQKINIKEIAKDKGVVFAILDPLTEPTRHIMVDIPLLKKEFDKEKVPFVFVIPRDKLTSDFSIDKYKNLPQNSMFVVNDSNLLIDKLLNSINVAVDNFYPMVLYVNSQNEITFISTGYKIGIGESLLKQMR